MADIWDGHRTYSLHKQSIEQEVVAKNPSSKGWPWNRQHCLQLRQAAQRCIGSARWKYLEVRAEECRRVARAKRTTPFASKKSLNSRWGQCQRTSEGFNTPHLMGPTMSASEGVGYPISSSPALAPDAISPAGRRPALWGGAHQQSQIMDGYAMPRQTARCFFLAKTFSQCQLAEACANGSANDLGRVEQRIGAARRLS
jgi:hypothetical protein